MTTILTSSQQTFVDITDQRKLSAYITSNLPKTQSEDPNVLPHTYAPSWASTNLVLTPVLFLDQTNVSPTASGVTISWKRKDGVASETVLTNGETVKNGVLTVNQNKLSASSSGMITYICYISYYDSETKNTINITADITYTLVKNAENAKLCTVSSDTYVFKYDTSQALVGASQATLTVQVQGVTVSKWQYKNSSGAWADYPTTSDNTSITGGTLVVKPTHSVFVNNVAQIRVTTQRMTYMTRLPSARFMMGQKVIKVILVQPEQEVFRLSLEMRHRRLPVLQKERHLLQARLVFRLPDMLALRRLLVPVRWEHCLQELQSRPILLQQPVQQVNWSLP